MSERTSSVTVVRGPLALTTFAGTLTAPERELLDRISGALVRRRSGPEHRPGRASDPHLSHHGSGGA